MKKFNIIFISLVAIILLFGCVANKGEIKVSLGKKSSTTKSVSSVAIVNNQIKVTGQGFSGVTSLRIHNGSLDETLSVESASATEIIANGVQAISIGVGQTFDLILSSAEGSATFPVIFSLNDGSITPVKLSTSGAHDGDILKFVGSAWVLSSLPTSQVYIGTWDASTNTPDANATVSPTAGEYYIVTQGGSYDLNGTGSVTYAIGDWIMYNAVTSNWDKVLGPTLGANYVTKAGDSMSGLLALDNNLKIKGSSNSNYVTLKANATTSNYNFVFPTNGGTSGYVLSTDGSGNTSWIAAAAGNVGTVTNVLSANADIVVATGTSTPTLTLNSGTGANQVVKLNGSSQLPAVNGSLLTSLNPANLSGAVAVNKGGTGLTAGTAGGFPYYDSTSSMASTAAGTTGQLLISGGAGAPTWLTALPIANGGTGATTLGAAQSALGITVGGATTGTAAIVGTGGVVANKICSGDAAGGGISCVNSTSSFLAGSISDESGTGALLFGTSPTILNPVIGNISPAGNFTLTQNTVVPFTSEATGAVANTLYLKAGQVGIGNSNPGSALDVKGTLRLSGSSSGYVGFAPAAAAGSTTYTLPAADGTSGQVLTTNASGVLSWTTVSGGGGGSGTVTNVTSANTDIGITAGTTIPVITLNAGTGADQIVKLTPAAKLPAVDGSLVTALDPTHLSAAVAVNKGGTGLTAGTSGGIPYFSSTSAMTSSALLGLNGIMIGGGAGGAPSTLATGTAGQILISAGASAPAWTTSLPIANGGTGATTLGTAQSALGISVGGATTGAAALVGLGGVVADKICSSDSSGGGISCVNTSSAFLAAAVSDESGTGLLLFGNSPTILSPVIGNIAPTVDFTLTQNTVVPFTSEGIGAVANTLYLKAGKVGIGNSNPGSTLDVKGTLRLSGSSSGYVGFAPAAAAGTTTYTLPTTEGTAGQVLVTNGVATTPTLSWSTPASAPVSSVNTLTGAVVLTTTQISEGTNLYATNARTIGATLDGFVTGANSTVLATDTILGAFEKTQGQINAKQSSITAATALSVGSVTTNLQGGVNVNPYNTAAGNTGEVRYYELTAGGSNYVGFKSPDTLGANKIWTLPAADGTSGQMLTTDGLGVLSWSSVAGGATGAAGGDLTGTYPNPTIGTGVITATHILDGTILNVDISASAAIADTKLATISTAGKVSGTAITSGNISTSGDVQTSGRMIASATSTTTAKLEVSGQILSKVYNAGAGTAIDWNNGNVQYSSANCAPMTFSNMFEGGTYSLIVTGGSSGTCTFSQSSPDTLSSFKFVPANAATIGGKTTVFTFLRAGSIVYVNWSSGY